MSAPTYSIKKKPIELRTDWLEDAPCQIQSVVFEVRWLIKSNRTFLSFYPPKKKNLNDKPCQEVCVFDFFLNWLIKDDLLFPRI